MNTFKKISAILLVLAMVLSMVPLSALAEDYPAITLGEEKTVTLDGETITAMTFRFTPEESGRYRFYSYEGEHDTYGYILDADGNVLAEDDDDGEERNFSAVYRLTAGTTYLLKAKFFSSNNSGTMKVQVEKAPDPTAVVLDPAEDYTEGLHGGRYFYYSFQPEGTEANITYSSSDPEIVSVRDDGYVSGMAPGTATITITTDNGLTDSVTVTVVDAIDIELDTEYTVSPAVCHSGAYRFTPTESGVYRFRSYNVANTTRFRIYNSDGNPLAFSGSDDPNEFTSFYELTAGETYIYVACYSAYSETTPFQVKLDKPVPATGITLNRDSASGYPGGQIMLTPAFAPENGIPETVTWSSSDESVATVGTDGAVVLVNLGNATITATSANGLTATCAVTVVDYPSIACCDTKTITIESAYESAWFRFIPEVDGTYAFYSKASFDTKAYLYSDPDRGYLGYSDDEGEGSNFQLQYEMTAGTGYLFCAQFYSSTTGSFDVTLMKVDENGIIGHQADQYTYTDTEHSGTCTLCGEQITEDHVYDSNYNCFCGYIHENHTSSDYSYDGEIHAGYCTLCGDYFEAGHSFDAEGDCVCGYFDHEHVYSNWDWDDEIHQSQCDLCNLYMTENHAPGDDGKCVCGYFPHTHTGTSYTYTVTTHSYTCGLCNETISENHTYDDDGNCVCGYYDHIHQGAQMSYVESCHGGLCDLCGLTVYDIAHSYDADGYCICGYFQHTHYFTQMSYNGSSHWGYCDACGLFFNEAHGYDETEHCACGYFIHEHNADGFDYDNGGHWSVCSLCGLEDGDDYTPHVYNDQGECQDCGRAQMADVYIGDIQLSDGQYLDNAGNITTEAPAQGGYAHYLDGVLTLHDFIFKGEANNPVFEECGIYAEKNLILKLEGQNLIRCTYGDGIYMAAANLTIRGEGVLQVFGEGNFDGIDVSGGDLKIESGILYVDGSDHGIEVWGDLTINGGTIIIKAGDDGMDINGDLTINGGIFHISAEDHGIDGYQDVTINGGDFYIETNDDNGFDADDGDITINGGSFEFDTNDECFSCSYSIYINGGKFIFDAGSGDAAIQSGTGIFFDEAMGDLSTATVGAYIVLVDAEGNQISDTVLVPADAGDEIAIEYDWIHLSEEYLYYTGKNITPTVTVKDDDGNTLVAGRDYTLTRSAETIKEPGLYPVIVEGIGQYRAKHVIAVWMQECQVYVGDQLLSIGEYIDLGGNITTEKPQGGYAYLFGNVLELNNYSYEGAGVTIDHGTYSWDYAIYGLTSLKIVLVGENSIVNTNEINEGDAIGGEGSLTISGQGSLTVRGEFGLYTDSTVTIESGRLTVDAAYTAAYGYAVIINGGSLVLHGDYRGLEATNYVSINGGISDISGDVGIYADYWMELKGGVARIDGETIGVGSYDLYVYDGYMEVNGGVWVDDHFWVANNVSVVTPEDYTYVEDTYGDNTYYCVIADADGNIADHVVIRGEDTQDIKWQLKAGATAGDATTDLRLISWVDTLENYSKVTFTVSFFDDQGQPHSAEMACTKTYAEILANGVSVGPASNLFGEIANYYVTYVIEDWPQMYYDIPVYVTVTWYDLDGEPMNHANRIITLSDAM